jgi:hypothetical protein
MLRADGTWRRASAGLITRTGLRSPISTRHKPGSPVGSGMILSQASSDRRADRAGDAFRYEGNFHFPIQVTC